MSAPQDTTAEAPASMQLPPRPDAQPLTFDLDVEVCVVGGGVAGLVAALEAARLGADVALLEAKRIGAGASARPLGTVKPGFDLPLADLITRVGLADARALWALSTSGMAFIRRMALDHPELALSEGALDVATVDIGRSMDARLQMLNADFGMSIEGWPTDRVRDTLRTKRYFQAFHDPHAFQIDGAQYLECLLRDARAAGVRIFEETPVQSIDASGIRKRIVTPHARLRAAHLVLAGNVGIASSLRRLGGTLLPVWRYAAISEPLGERLAETIRYHGSICDGDGVDHYRIVSGDRLMWCSPETTWAGKPARHRGAIRRRIAAVYPQLGKVALAQVWSGAVGCTVHGMPQIGALRQGLWVASGFGRQGLATSAMAGQLVARGLVLGDDRWRQFSPFELVWAGGATGRVVGQAVGAWTRGTASAANAFARYREGALVRDQRREARREAANRQVRQRVLSAPPAPSSGSGRDDTPMP